MILWTIQPYSIYKKLMKNGFYICNPNKSEMLNNEDGYKDLDKQNTSAYQWMIKQMKDRIGNPPSNVTYPVWAWYRWNYRHQHPKFYNQATSQVQVCMKIKIPDEQVLLSDFDNWHYVLNRWYLNTATNQKDWDKQDIWFNSLPKDQAKEVMEQSWQKIFDITPRRGVWTMNGGFVQACFWKLYKDQICKVWRIERGRKSYRLDLKNKQ